jgi:hypothetical protein
MKAVTRTMKALITTAVLTLTATAVEAQQLCLLRDSAVSQLEEQYSERVLGRGLAQGGKAMVELFVGKTGSWTVVVTDTEGRSCVVSSGDGWTPVPLLAGDPA